MASSCSPGVGTGWGFGKLCGPNDADAKDSARDASRSFQEERSVDNKSDRRHDGMLRARTAMRSLWPRQPQRTEAGPFAVRMQSFSLQTCPANGVESLSLAGLFLNSSKL